MAITKYSDVNEEGEPRHQLDELSAKGTTKPVVEVKQENSQSASPESYFLDRSPKVRKRRRLVRKSFVLEDSPQLDELEEDQSQPPKRKSEVRKRRVQKVKDGQERMVRDGRRACSKKAKVGSSESKLEKLARNIGGGNRERISGADLQRSGDGKREKSPWEDPDAAKCSEEEKELEPTQDNSILNYDSYAVKAGEGQEDDTDHMDDDLRFFKSKKKKVSNEGTSVEIALFVEKFLAKLDVAAEADADLNRASKPAIEKLKLLPKLLNLLEKRHLQDEFLDRGILSSVRIWLEPLPDGSLPNVNIRSALLKLLTNLPIDVEVFERSEQLKKSKLGRAVSFFSRLQEEIPANKKLARDLVYKWSRPIFQKSTRYEDLRRFEDERPLPSRLPVVKKKKPVPEPRLEESRGRDEFEFELHLERELQPGHPGYRYRASRPQALPLDFVIRPASKMDADSVRAQAKLKLTEEKRSNTNKQRSNINKKLQQLAKRKRENLQAARPSVHGR